MDREIVISILLLVVLTWLLYKLIVRLEPHDKPAAGKPPGDVSTDSATTGAIASRQKPIYQRLRK